MITEAALETLRHHVGDAFKAGMGQFPHFTLHGIEHLEELDRLARLLQEVIPLPQERLMLLRLALILHDYAMVDVPDSERECELRKRMSSEESFADIVRKSHQDEIINAFSRPSKRDFLNGLGLLPMEIKDAIEVARHHRYHPLLKAREDLQVLCALMRLIDELDIGPKRAPLATYLALRSRMEPISKLHWLKHLCTRPLEGPEIMRHGAKTLVTFRVSIEATEGTWRPLQGLVVGKIERCLDQEKIHRVLRERFQVEFRVLPDTGPSSGTNGYLPTEVEADLKELEGSALADTTPRPPPRSSRGDPVVAQVQKIVDGVVTASDSPSSADDNGHRVVEELQQRLHKLEATIQAKSQPDGIARWEGATAIHRAATLLFHHGHVVVAKELLLYLPEKAKSIFFFGLLYLYDASKSSVEGLRLCHSAYAKGLEDVEATMAHNCLAEGPQPALLKRRLLLLSHLLDDSSLHSSKALDPNGLEASLARLAAWAEKERENYDRAMKYCE